jgi:hypothetical protein
MCSIPTVLPCTPAAPALSGLAADIPDVPAMRVSIGCSGTVRTCDTAAGGTRACASDEDEEEGSVVPGCALSGMEEDDDDGRGGGGGGGGAGTTCRGWWRSPVGNAAYVRWTAVPSRPLARLAAGIGPSLSSSFVLLDDAWALDVDAEVEAAAAEEEDFLLWRADVKRPSGTSRSRSHGIVSIVFRLPSVLFVKYASARARAWAGRRWAGVSVSNRVQRDRDWAGALRCHFRCFFLPLRFAASAPGVLSGAVLSAGSSGCATSCRRTE